MLKMAQFYEWMLKVIPNEPHTAHRCVHKQAP